MPTNPEQPVYAPSPENTRLALKDVVAMIVFAASVGGFIYQSKAVAEDVAVVKSEIQQKADAKDTKTQNERLSALERLMSVQVQINEQQAKANDLQAKANDKNEIQHEKIIEKLDRALSKK
jgi:hypothetical protein